ncbi:phage tail assembly chaperone [Clostridium sp.]|uniref:phage tail assembly chaperone n=1 Tax=Clostridium sp. TaxID=1506 RepID=UPI003F3BC323
MSIVDLLLNADIEQIQRPTKVVEVKRLSKALGGEFKLMCKALTYDKYTKIQEDCISISAKGEIDIDQNKMNMEMLLSGVFNEDGTQFFSNKDLQKHFKVPSSKELIKKLLLTGEIESISNHIQQLSGFNNSESMVEEIKGL